MLKASITVPRARDLVPLKPKPILRKAAARMATLIRSRLRKGVDSLGRKMRKPKESTTSRTRRLAWNKAAAAVRKEGFEAKNVRAGRPLNRTGALINSIRAGKVRGSGDDLHVNVGPKGYRTDAGKGQKAHLAVAAALQQTGGGRRGVVFMEPTPAEAEEIARLVEAEIEKQLAKL